jgi:hypothetical protein
MPHAPAARVGWGRLLRFLANRGKLLADSTSRLAPVVQISRTHSSPDNSRSADRFATRAPGRRFGGCRLRVSREDGRTG